MICTLFSPYRICPLGAHVDHQGGTVLGRPIALGTTIDYEPLDSNEIHLISNQFGAAKFTSGEIDLQHWARYAQAAARVLKAQRGLRAHINGPLVGAGLSSSASVGLAYLKALADVNAMALTDDQLVQLDFKLEHDQLGLQNGLLDPLSIVYGRRDALILMDTRSASITPIADPRPADFTWIVAYSGVSRELTKSGFNARVAECHAASALLQDGARTLSDVPHEVFEERKAALPDHLRRRAEHFFTEVDRVQRGARAWQNADLELIGHLMNQSCASSINNYEVGSDILIELHELVSGASGIYGSRFSGGGYGGCVVALARRDLADRACAEIAEKFFARHPELASQVFVVEMADGISRGVTDSGSDKANNQAEAAPSASSRWDTPPESRATLEIVRPVRSAVLLAAGRGKRQRPYTDVTPKPLLEVNGRATLDYVLCAVAKAGIERVCIVTHHLAEQIVAFVGDGSRWNLAVTFAQQADLRGTGDALLSVPKDWIHDDPVMIVATDYVLEEHALLELVNAYRRSGADIIMSLKECPREELAVRSSVAVDAAWRVTRIIEKPQPEAIMSPYAASILFILPPAVWDYLLRIQPSSRGEIELQSAVELMLRDGFTASGLLQSAPQEWNSIQV